MTGLIVRTFFSIHDIEAQPWDQLAQGHPFQSHQWYVYGERVMDDCSPVYLLAYQGDELIARASFWLVRNEPIPKIPAPLRVIARGLIRHWPPLICRSPLANISGLIVKDGLNRNEILKTIAQTAVEEAASRGASFAVFDYLDEASSTDWPAAFGAIPVSEPGTVMKNHWNNLEEYLSASINKKERRQYKRVMQVAHDFRLQLTRYKKVTDIKGALDLIRNVEQRHGALPNPWVPSMLENMQMVNGTWLEVHAGQQLVGCMLLLEDNHAQMATALGLAEGISDVYFLLLFAALETAMEHKVRLLRWGSGAYEAKRRLGFQLEQNNYVSICGANWLTRRFVRAFTTGSAN